MKKPEQHPIAEVPRRQAKVEITIGIGRIGDKSLVDHVECEGRLLGSNARMGRNTLRTGVYLCGGGYFFCSYSLL